MSEEVSYKDKHPEEQWFSEENKYKSSKSSMNREEELEYRRKYLESCSVEDYLEEDPEIYNQKYFLLSYLLPEDNNDLEFPVIKIRGSYRTEEECKKRLEKLNNLDNKHNKIIGEVGKFGSLLPFKELHKNEDIDIQYRSASLNDFMKKYDENRERADKEFEIRKQQMVKKATFEGSKEGQEILSSQKEEPFVIKERIKMMENVSSELKQKLRESLEILQDSTEKLKEFTEEEIKASEEKIKNHYSNEQNGSSSSI